MKKLFALCFLSWAVEVLPREVENILVPKGKNEGPQAYKGIYPYVFIKNQTDNAVMVALDNEQQINNNIRNWQIIEAQEVTIRCIGYAHEFLVADAIRANTQDKDEVGERRIKDKVIIKADLSVLLSQTKVASSKSNTLDILLKDAPEDTGVVAVIEEGVPSSRTVHTYSNPVPKQKAKNWWDKINDFFEKNYE